MLFRLIVLFTVVPFVELALLIKLGSVIGATETVMLVIITGVVGALLVRSAGVQCLYRIQSSLQAGRIPTDELINGGLILVAGAFLVTPGLLTDTAGFLLLIPATRELIKQRLSRYIKLKVDRGDFRTHIDIR